jgi:hypothetical protein
MYTHILEAALRERSQPDAGMTTDEALTVLCKCRQHLDSMVSERGMDWSSAALANQVAYDLALIDLAGCVGLDSDPSSFDQPEHRRMELEREVTSRGIRLDELDQRASSTTEHR